MTATRAIDVIKRSGRRPSEPFTRDKLHASIVAACLSVHTPSGQAQDVADKVCDAVIVWSKNKHEVTSADLRRQANRTLTVVHPEAAYIYSNNRVII